MRISEVPRPSPERLLKQVQAEESKRWGARLKIFLGYAPGVGKSYRMLDEARRRHERGEDVVVGALQGQRSEEVQALISNLELIAPLQSSEGEMVDVEAVAELGQLKAKDNRNVIRSPLPNVSSIELIKLGDGNYTGLRQGARWLFALPKTTRAWEPTFLWNHRTQLTEPVCAIFDESSKRAATTSRSRQFCTPAEPGRSLA
jgi:osmosensitive K+ channel His kinase sensor protein